MHTGLVLAVLVSGRQTQYIRAQQTRLGRQSCGNNWGILAAQYIFSHRVFHAAE